MTMEIKLEVYSGTGGARRNIALEHDLSGELTFKEFLQFEKSVKISVAEDERNYQQDTGAFDKDPRTRVDGVYDAPVVNVKPFGTIEYIAKATPKEVLLFAYEAILSRSPGDTGLYLSSNWLFYNGVKIAETQEELRVWLDRAKGIKDSDVFRFVNLTPYARRLELAGISRFTRGKNRGLARVKGRRKKVRKLKVEAKAPNGAYHLAFGAIKRKHAGATARFREEFVSGSQISGLPVKSNFRTAFASGKYKSGVGRPYLYPSIVIQFSSKGATL